MAGLVIPVLPKRSYDFSNLIAGTTQSIVLASRIDVSEYIDCMLAVRVHDGFTSGLNVLNVDVYGDGYTDQDPGLFFLTAAPFFPSSALNSNAVGFLIPYGGTVHGHFVSVVLTVTKPAPICRMTLSVDMVLRTPDDSP